MLSLYCRFESVGLYIKFRRTTFMEQSLEGNIDFVTPEGLIEGWYWNESLPDERVTVIITIDGVEAGRTQANLFRQDLEQAGKGDGRHMFRHVLPFALLGTSRGHTLTIADAASGIVVGRAYELHAKQTIKFDDRLSALERRAALLEERMSELRPSLVSEVSAGELFAVVGAFFERLARDIARGMDVKPERLLGDGIRSLMTCYPALVFPTNPQPTFSIVINADHPLSTIYACLVALRAATAKLAVRVTVIDTGAFEELALLPSLARGIHYIRAEADLVSEWIATERQETCPFLVVLSGQVTLETSCLEVLFDWFADCPHTGAVGGCEADSEGTLLHAGICRFDDQLEDCAEVGAADKRVDLTLCNPVHALSNQIAMIRREALKAVGGFDPIFGQDLGAAMIDLCFRMREAAWLILSEPRARVRLPARSQETWKSPALSTPSSAGDVLYRRWLSPKAPSLSPLISGVAVIISQPDFFPDELEAVRCLRDTGFVVLYVGARPDISESESNILKYAGARIAVKIGEDGEMVPDLVFIASTAEDAIKLAGKSNKAKIVCGLGTLRRVLTANFHVVEI